MLRSLANFGVGTQLSSHELPGQEGVHCSGDFVRRHGFGAAGTSHYWQAWLFLAAYFAPSLAVTLHLVKNDPALPARRMSGGPFAEKEPLQKIIMSIVSLGFVGLIVLPAIGHRVGWSQLSPTMVLIGDLLVLTGWLGIFPVYRENSFDAATIDLSEDQRVISTGPYAWVRHPIYAAGLLMLSGIPLALGSRWSVLLVLVLLPALIWRLKHEEEFLGRNLPGYRDYNHDVYYRLIPSIWWHSRAAATLAGGLTNTSPREPPPRCSPNF